MNSIDNQTKKLLKNKNWETPSSFEELGYIYFGPIIFNFFIWLSNEVKGCDKVLFNSREGHFLEKIYTVFKERYNLPESVYFKTSRRLASLAYYSTKDDIYNSFKSHRYEGYLSNLLKDRFGIQHEVEHDYIIDTRTAIPNIDQYIDDILQKSSIVRNEYKKYVMEVIGDAKNVAMVDSGFQGTTQYYIQQAFGLTFKGRYFTFKNNRVLENTKGFYDINRTDFYKNIIFFESVFIDNVGSYIDILDGKFINERFDESVQFYDQKNRIVLGSIQFLNDMFTNGFDYDTASMEYPDYIFTLMCTDNFIKNNNLTSIFYHDNYYTRDLLKQVTRK